MDQVWGSTAQYHVIEWGWPIALYLFIAGLSAGALISALLVKWSARGKTDGLVKAGAIVAPVTIVIGLGLLVLDLGRPLAFYRLMVHYQLHSVMSLGVVFLMVYTVLSVLFALGAFKLVGEPWVALVERKALEWLTLLAAVAIAVYTGFLLSVLVAKPLFNTSMLPLLFLLSGMSAGVAANILVGMWWFGGSADLRGLRYLLALDRYLIPGELFVLFLMFVGLADKGGNYAVVAREALTSGAWATVFWLGVVAVGLVLPVVVATAALRRFEHADPSAGDAPAGLPMSTLLLHSGLVLVGVILLRFYILYAGQIFTGS